jgi:hypothetical protein
MIDSTDKGEGHPRVQRDVANHMNDGFVAKRTKNAERLAPENERGSDDDETQREAPVVAAQRRGRRFLRRNCCTKDGPLRS